MPINIGKLRFVDFIKASTSVSVKFTFETSITEIPRTLIIDAQDAKFGDYIALSSQNDRGSNSDQNNYIYRLLF